MMHSALRRAVAIACAGPAFLLGGCSGQDLNPFYGVDHPHGLICTSVCTPSETVATANLKVYFNVVDDGQGAQAQAGFRDHVSAFYNVELSGNDQVNLVDEGATRRMDLKQPTNIGDFGEPYVADLAAPLSPTREVVFQLQRADGTYTSTLTPPPAFTISSPTDGSTNSLTTTALPLTLTAVEPSPKFTWLKFDCADAGGNHAIDGFQGGYDPDSAIAQVDDMHWTFDAATFVSKLLFDSQATPGPIVHCDMQLQVQAITDGTPDPAFDANSFVTGTQTRTVSFTLQ